MFSSTMLHSLILSAIAYLAYLLIEFRDRAIGTTKRKDPSYQDVRGWPLLGQLPQSLVDISRGLEAGTNLALKFRPGFSITVPGLRIIDISKPEWLEYMQKTNFDNYQKGDLFQTTMADLFGKGILAIDGEPWKRTRFVMARVFSLSTFKTIIEPSANYSLDGVLRVLKSASAENKSLDFCDLFTRYTLDSFVHMTFGKALGLFGEEGTEDGQQQRVKKNLASPEVFSKAFEYAQRQIDLRFTMMSGWGLFEKVNSNMGNKMQSSCRIVHDYAYTLIDERISQITCEDDLNSTGKSHKDFLGLILAAHQSRNHNLDREELKDNALAFLLAGRDATAQSLSWSFFHLLMNKEIVFRIRKEISEIFTNDLDEEERVTHENYKQFVVTHAALFEALRLQPPVPKNLKFAVAADKFPGGPTIEAGDCVSWSDWQMARDPAIWGPDCGQFNPDRWIDEDGKIKSYGNFKFHVFNAGPRTCLGQNMAIFFAVKTIVEILHKFDLEFAEGWWENVPKSEELAGIKTNYPTPHYEASLTLPMKSAMMISMKARVFPGRK